MTTYTYVDNNCNNSMDWVRICNGCVKGNNSTMTINTWRVHSVKWLFQELGHWVLLSPSLEPEGFHFFLCWHLREVSLHGVVGPFPFFHC